MDVVSRLPIAAPRDLTDGNTICSLMYTSISGTCHVKTVQVIYEKLQNQLNHLFKGSTKF